LVCDGKDVGKVIFWQHNLDTSQVYPNYPPGENNDFWIEGPDLWTWLISTFQETKEAFEEYEEWEKEQAGN